MGASYVAIVIARERRIAELFQAAGATSPERSRTPTDLGILEKGAFRLLKRHGVLVESNPGFYYLDLDAWEAMRLRRKRFAAAALGVVIIAGLFLAWTTFTAL